MRVLIVEDEVFLAEALQAGLRHEAIAADVSFDGDDALERVAVERIRRRRTRPRHSGHPRRRRLRRDQP
jgi:DNA-binding response OmpR family regulator